MEETAAICGFQPLREGFFPLLYAAFTRPIHDVFFIQSFQSFSLPVAILVIVLSALVEDFRPPCSADLDPYSPCIVWSMMVAMGTRLIKACCSVDIEMGSIRLCLCYVNIQYRLVNAASSQKPAFEHND